MNKEIYCIICPRSCLLKRNEDGKIEGYSCLRGLKYGEQEFISPKRTITTFIRTKNNEIVCVKTSVEIDKKLIPDVIEFLKNFHPEGSFEVGDVIVKNILNTDADIIVTRVAI